MKPEIRPAWQCNYVNCPPNCCGPVRGQQQPARHLKAASGATMPSSLHGARTASLATRHSFCVSATRAAKPTMPIATTKRRSGYDAIPTAVAARPRGDNWRTAIGFGIVTGEQAARDLLDPRGYRHRTLPPARACHSGVLGLAATPCFVGLADS